MYFVTLLTNQFLYFKNREDLQTTQLKIQELLYSEKDTLSAMSPDNRIPHIFRLLEDYYIFDNYKTLVTLFDTNGKTSYPLNKDVYDLLILDQFKINPANIDFNVSFNKDILQGKEILTFELFKKLNASETIKYKDISLLVPTRGESPFISESDVMGFDVMYTVVRIDIGEEYSLLASVFIYPDLDQDFLLSLNSALLVSAIIGILFLSIFAKFFTRKALKPLVDLSKIAQGVDNKILNYRIPPTESHDEIDTLIKSLNTMLENLEGSFENQKRFVSDASHELRIPLTIVLGYIDLLKTMGTGNEALLKESLDAIELEATHMKNMVEKLLTLARLENNRIKVTYEEITVSEFFRKGLEECIRLYPLYHFKTELNYEGLLYIDLEIMTQIFRALVENAVKYSLEDTTITFKSEQRNQYIALSLIDQGRGIAKESIPNLTNRFYRLNEDRNRRTGGSGLGLSIVDALIKAHGGHMRIESEVRKGTTITLFIPKKKPL